MPSICVPMYLSGGVHFKLGCRAFCISEKGLQFRRVWHNWDLLKPSDRRGWNGPTLDNKKTCFGGNFRLLSMAWSCHFWEQTEWHRKNKILQSNDRWLQCHLFQKEHPVSLWLLDAVLGVLLLRCTGYWCNTAIRDGTFLNWRGQWLVLS